MTGLLEGLGNFGGRIDVAESAADAHLFAEALGLDAIALVPRRLMRVANRCAHTGTPAVCEAAGGGEGQSDARGVESSVGRAQVRQLVF